MDGVLCALPEQQCRERCPNERKQEFTTGGGRAEYVGEVRLISPSMRPEGCGMSGDVANLLVPALSSHCEWHWSESKRPRRGTRSWWMNFQSVYDLWMFAWGRNHRSPLASLLPIVLFTFGLKHLCGDLFCCLHTPHDWYVISASGKRGLHCVCLSVDGRR